MAGIYGADRWERAYGARWREEWAQALGHCTLADLARGVERCERDDSGRLPTLGQVVALCREYQPGTFAGAARPAALPTLAQLSAPRAGDSEVAAKHRAMWRRMRRGERLTREELEELPPVQLHCGTWVYPALYPPTEGAP